MISFQQNKPAHFFFVLKPVPSYLKLYVCLMSWYKCHCRRLDFVEMPWNINIFYYNNRHTECLFTYKNVYMQTTRTLYFFYLPHKGFVQRHNKFSHILTHRGDGVVVSHFSDPHSASIVLFSAVKASEYANDNMYTLQSSKMLVYLCVNLIPYPFVESWKSGIYEMLKYGKIRERNPKHYSFSNLRIVR